jgi:hypothetical protein
VRTTTTLFSTLCSLLPQRQGTIGEYHRGSRARSFASLNACTPKEERQGRRDSNNAADETANNRSNLTRSVVVC